MIYLDNAATTFPKPAGVIKAVNEAMTVYGANPGRGGHSMTLRAGKIVYRARERLAELFFCSPERVIFTLNCTAALNTAIRGTLKKGDHVIISSLEHNSILRPVEAMKNEGLITYDVFTVYPSDSEKTLEEIAKLIKSNTAAVICTAVSNVFGTVLPLKEIASLVRDKGILFIVDGAQAAGGHTLNMRELGIDILCVPGHKGLMGPMGTGALMMSEGISVEPFVFGGTGSNSMSELQPDYYPDKLESGTANFPGVAGLSAGAGFVKSCGESAILDREWELVRLLLEDLHCIRGIRVYDDMICGKTNLISFNFADIHSEQVSDFLSLNGIAVRAGYQCSYLAHKNYGTQEKGTVRVSFGPFNTKKDVKNLSFYLNKIALDKNLC